MPRPRTTADLVAQARVNRGLIWIDDRLRLPGWAEPLDLDALDMGRIDSDRHLFGIIETTHPQPSGELLWAWDALDESRLVALGFVPDDTVPATVLTETWQRRLDIRRPKPRTSPLPAPPPTVGRTEVPAALAR